MLLYEFKADLNAYLAGLGPQAPVHSLEEIIEFNEAHRERVMPFFGQERMIKAQAKGPLTEERYLKALAAQSAAARARKASMPCSSNTAWRRSWRPPAARPG